MPGTRRRLGAALAAFGALLAACSRHPATTGAARPLVVSAIPDQDPEKLQRLYSTLAGYLQAKLKVPVRYVPVTDYAAAVSLFRTGDLDLVWFGGLTGVQARLGVKGARAIVQRDIDQSFHSVFIVSRSTGLAPASSLSGLAALRGQRFTFGSESSTSGRLMPEYFLGKAGVKPADFAGPPGFSGSHDRTIELVKAGTYEAGVLNEQVWKDRVAAGKVDPAAVIPFFTTPAFHDYHWLIQPGLDRRYGDGFAASVRRAFTEMDPSDAAARQILGLFGAGRFIPTGDSNYAQIEEAGRALGLVH